MLTWYSAFPQFKSSFQECWRGVFVPWLVGLVQTLLWVSHFNRIPHCKQHPSSLVVQGVLLTASWQGAQRALEGTFLSALGCGVDQMCSRRSRWSSSQNEALEQTEYCAQHNEGSVWASAYTPETSHLNLSQLLVPQCWRTEKPITGGKSVLLLCRVGCCFTHYLRALIPGTPAKQLTQNSWIAPEHGWVDGAQCLDGYMMCWHPLHCLRFVDNFCIV